MTESMKILVGLAIALLAISSLMYDFHCNDNCVAMLSGLWSAAATAVLGWIAYRQNKKYKQLSDQQNDLAFMPELYISTALTDVISGMGNLSSLSKVRGVIEDNIETRICQPIRLWILRGPIVNLKVAEIRCGKKRWVCSEAEGRTFRDDSVPFNLVLDIPKETDEEGSPFVAILEYENVYGTKYQKEIWFTAKDSHTSPDVQELKKARRIDNG